MKSRLILAAILGLCACAQAPGAAAIDPPLEATLSAPAEVVFDPAGRKRISIAVAVTLRNNGRGARRLSAPTPCHVHQWIVVDSGGAKVQDKPRAICTQNVVEKSVAAGETISGTGRVQIGVRKLRDGASYTIRYRFWGVATSTTFTARRGG